MAMACWGWGRTGLAATAVAAVRSLIARWRTRWGVAWRTTVAGWRTTGASLRAAGLRAAGLRVPRTTDFLAAGFEAVLGVGLAAAAGFGAALDTARFDVVAGALVTVAAFLALALLAVAL